MSCGHDHHHHHLHRLYRRRRQDAEPSGLTAAASHSIARATPPLPSASFLARVRSCSVLRFTYAYLGVETPFNPAVHHKDMEFKVSGGHHDGGGGQWSSPRSLLWLLACTAFCRPAVCLPACLQDKGGRALVLIPLKQKGDRVKTGDIVETPSLTRALATQTQVDFRLYALPEKIPECIPGVPGRRWTVLQEGVTSTGDNPHVRDLQRACLITVPLAPGASSNCKLRLQFGGAAIIAQAIDESTGKIVESAIKY